MNTNEIFRESLTHIMAGESLDRDRMLQAMTTLMSGEWTSAQIAAFLVALRMKGESIEEIAAAAEVMRHLSTKVELTERDNLIDTCGTGGDSSHTFNVSTASALVAAAAGARVAKHGGRSVSSTCGSADVLEALGVNVGLPAIGVAQCVENVGIGFMFAPNHHGAMKHAAPVRRELGMRTLFNVLGPLTNPAGARRQVLGVYAPEMTAVLARVLDLLGSEHVLVVHGACGMDEISISGETRVAELKNGQIREYRIRPDQFGMTVQPLASIQVRNVSEAQERLLAVLDNRPGAARDIVSLNAGAAIYVAGLAESLEAGVARAQAVLASGAARAKLDALVAFSREGAVNG